MDSKLDRRFPSLAEIEKAALRRMPGFIADYIYCGMGNGDAVQRNLDALAAIQLLPRYGLDVGQTILATSLFGNTWQAPFGIAPVGLGGFAWPLAAEILAQSAKKYNLPFCSSTFALASLEKLRHHGGDSAWFQLYRPNVAEVESDMIERARHAGYRVMMVTVDIPAPMRRAHDIKNGFSIPPQLNWFNLRELFTHPLWSYHMISHAIKNGFPRFETLEQYVPAGLNVSQSMQYKADMALGQINIEAIRKIRDAWPGTLLVKGVLDPRDALLYQEQGVDGILISNHGGRQLAAAPSALEMLPLIRAAVGKDYPLLVDGGVRSGLDICRMLASGADFVLLGRPFYYAVAAMGRRGADHIVELLLAEMHCVMGQLGCSDIAELPARLYQKRSRDPCMAQVMSATAAD